MKKPKEPRPTDFNLAEWVEQHNAYGRCSLEQVKRVKMVGKWNKWKRIQERKNKKRLLSV